MPCGRIIVVMRGLQSREPVEPRSLDVQLKAAGVDRARVLSGLTRRQLLRRAAVAIGVVAVVALAIVELPALHAVRARLADAHPGWIVASAVMEAVSVACFALALQRAFKDRLGPRGAISLGTTSQGVNAVVPAGGTAGFAFAAVILADVGFPAASTVARLIALFLITSVLTNLLLIIVGGGGAAFGVLTAHASLGAIVVPAVLALVLLAAFTIALKPARRGRSSAPSAPARASSRVSFVRDAIGLSGELLRDRDPWLAVGALGYVVCDLVALAAALAALGWDGLGAGTVILGYTLGQLGSVIPLPGATEGGLAGALGLYGAPLSLAVPAVLVYRTIAIAVPVLLAAVGAVQLRHGLEVTGASDTTWPATT
jgi:glycosyltransferase 2 family protein